jgi:hypothetical protein
MRKPLFLKLRGMHLRFHLADLGYNLAGFGNMIYANAPV